MNKTHSAAPQKRSSAGLVYLMYHEIELPGRPLCQSEPGYVRYIVTEADFRNQLSELKKHQWRGLSVGEALTSPTAPAVVFTFDDGCETDLLAAAPLLKDAGLGATFYITVGFLGKRGYLSPGQVRVLSDLGFEIGCHSMTHPYLSDLATNDLPKEIAAPKEKLEQMTGREVVHFSCPGGRFDTRVVQAARDAGYHSLATSQTTRNGPRTDPFDLGRVAIMRDTTMLQFWRTCQGRGLRWTRWNARARAAAKAVLGNSIYDRARSALLKDSGSVKKSPGA